MALNYDVSHISIWVQFNFLVLGFYQMQNDMTAIFAHAFTIAKPFVAILVLALHHSVWIVNSTISAMVLRQRIKIVQRQV